MPPTSWPKMRKISSDHRKTFFPMSSRNFKSSSQLPKCEMRCAVAIVASLCRSRSCASRLRSSTSACFREVMSTQVMSAPALS